MRVTEGNTNLGGRETLAGELDDVLDDVLGRGLQPGRGSAAVGEGRGRYPARRSKTSMRKFITT